MNIKLLVFGMSALLFCSCASKREVHRLQEQVNQLSTKVDQFMYESSEPNEVPPSPTVLPDTSAPKPTPQPLRK